MRSRKLLCTVHLRACRRCLFMTLKLNCHATLVWSRARAKCSQRWIPFVESYFTILITKSYFSRILFWSTFHHNVIRRRGCCCCGPYGSINPFVFQKVRICGGSKIDFCPPCVEVGRRGLGEVSFACFSVFLRGGAAAASTQKNSHAAAQTDE